MEENEEHGQKPEPDDNWLKELKEPKRKEKAGEKELYEKFPKQPAKNELAKYAGMGSELFAAVVFGALIGYWLDVLFHTKPWCLLGGMILGSLGGFWNVYRIIVQEEEEAKIAAKEKE